jgi:hypothetical protein
MDFSVNSSAPARGIFRKWVGGLVGFGIFIVVAGGFFYSRVDTASQSGTSSAVGPIVPNDAAATAHATEPWYDSSEPGNLKPVFEGQAYTVGPDRWTVIDVRPPATPGRYKYDVRFEGINHFRARPDGDARREFIYPSGQNLQPYQISGEAQTFWVQALDGGVHQVRVKYVRTAAREQSGRTY